MFLVVSALAYLAISMIVVLAIDFVICHKYRARQPAKERVAVAPVRIRPSLRRNARP